MTITTNAQLSHETTVSTNPEAFTIRNTRGLTRKPEYHVYIHSISKRSFPIDHLLFPKQVLRGCKEGERYTTCMLIPEPVVQIAPDEANGGRRGYEEDAWRVAIDILNPNNLSRDPYQASDPSTHTSANCDLIRQGLFPSLNKVPTEAELQRADKALETYYRSLTERATTLDSLNRRSELDELLSSNPDVGVAMDYFGLTAAWHRKYTVTHACPKCGEQVKQGLAFHAIPGVGICVIDWKGAVGAGVKTRADVPEELRWWEEKRGPGRPAA